MKYINNSVDIFARLNSLLTFAKVISKNIKFIMEFKFSIKH